MDNTQEFQAHLDSLHKVYTDSTLKEKHRLNEHIKHLIKTYGELEVKDIKKDIKDETAK